MLRLFFSALLLGMSVSALAQQYSMALGIHTGMTVPYTYDQGISNDPRYQERYSAKLAPIGLMFSVDFSGIGFLTNPGIVTLAQDYSIVNTDGGHDGRRKINLNYLQVPLGVKIHIIDLSFFRVSGVASFSVAYLLNSSDKITHTNTKLVFPEETLLPPEYTREFDGVVVPAVKNQTVIAKENYNSLQFFAGLGIRTDWDVTNVWRLSFDFRVNYGLTDPRTKDYLAKVDKFETLYDTPGKRNEMFAHINVGIARYIDWDQHDRDRKKGQPVKQFPGQKRRR